MRFKASKSRFSSVCDSDSVIDPIVISPCNRRRGHFSRICLAVTINSESAGESSDSGARPDFESSPEVLTCSRTLRGEESRSAGRALFTASAALIDDMVWIVCRFGIADINPQY